MASISNSGKSITVAFSSEEKSLLMECGGEDWKWQVPQFAIEQDGTGILSLRADMLNGRKLGAMSGSSDRWLLVIPSVAIPLMPYFKKVYVELMPVRDTKMSELRIPRELPMIDMNKPKRAAKKPIIDVVPTIVPVVEKSVGNVSLMIEGETFHYRLSLEKRISLMETIKDYRI